MRVAASGSIIRVGGMVQGVGFRPFVWRLASDMQLAGTVRNTSAGVVIELLADRHVADAFVARMVEEKPGLSRIDRVSVEPAPVLQCGPGFSILDSEGGAVATAVTPDAAICADCAREIADPADRRYGYAFANCTNCGPRLSIIRKIPYDRANTAMARFAMCAACRAEYENPADRRFHAEPIACAECGPRLWIRFADGRPDPDPGHEITSIANLLLSGGIVALKGLGGFHIACLADSDSAVQRLRQRKRRLAKPFALMAPDIDAIRNEAVCSEDEARLLASSSGPIVLLDRLPGSTIALSVAPGQAGTGFMLPTTPLHRLLLAATGRILVMTSANESGRPQVIANDEAEAQLFDLADAILFHDRDIENRVDDSVVRLDRHGPTIIRRARGFAPEPLLLPARLETAHAVLACGGDLKSTFCLAGRGEAVLSQHLGDLDEPETLGEYDKAIGLYMDLFGRRPDIVAIDSHPAYRSSMAGGKMALETGATLVKISHHHAHLAACMAENKIADEPVLGIILDGAGHGPDGTIWGGEFLLGGYSGVQRLAHFDSVPLPGGDRAAVEPWRNALAHLHAALGPDWMKGKYGKSPIAHAFGTRPVKLLDQVMANPALSPRASSAGRLFDAFAAVIGTAPERLAYEGQAAMELEALAAGRMDGAPPYPMDNPDGGVIRWRRLWEGVLDDVAAGRAAWEMSARFHATIIAVASEIGARLAKQSGTRLIALSGGVFQNRILAEEVPSRLEAFGLTPLLHRRVPANDGGLALGQAAIALYRAGDGVFRP